MRNMHNYELLRVDCVQIYYEFFSHTIYIHTCHLHHIGDHSGKNLLQLCKENGWNTLKHQLSSQQQQQNPIDRLVKPENPTEVRCIIIVLHMALIYCSLVENKLTFVRLCGKFKGAVAV